MAASEVVTLENRASIRSRFELTHTVVPTQTDPQTFILVLAFKRPDATPTIRMKLKGQEPSSAAVTMGKDSFEIKAAVQQLK